MKKDTRVQKISEIIKRDKDNPHGIQEVFWMDALKPMQVFKIPLEYLIYNKYNGRILSRTESLEQQGTSIDAETIEGRQKIEELLWKSSINRNKQTLESIKSRGQEKVGIITKDGIIIDGNRRAMLLKKSGKYNYFKAVVLPVTIEENPLEIEKLETTYQMGEDEKLGYNPIEKYLKAKNLKKRGVKEADIASWMGETINTVSEYLGIMHVMDDYLNYLGCDHIYTQLDEREEQLKQLYSWLKSFEGAESRKAFDGYMDTDVDDLKNISYDYIRVSYDHRKFRDIATGLKESHFFGDRVIWDSFCKFHFDNIEPIKDLEQSIDFKSEDLEAYLSDRNRKFKENCVNEKGDSLFEENFQIHKQKLLNKQSADKPALLASRASEALLSIDQRNRAFRDPKVMERVKEVNVLTSEMLFENDSAERLLSQAMSILNSINVSSEALQKDKIVTQLKEIQKRAYRLEKEVKALR